MMMKRQLFFSLCVTISLVIATLCVAEPIAPKFLCPQGATSSADTELIAKVQDAYKKLANFSAQFEQESYLSALDVSETSTGAVWFERPGKMKWDYASPEPQEFLVKDNTFWFYQHQDEQVTINSFEDVVLSELPISFLMGIGDLDRDFTLQGSCATPDHTLLSLTPKNGPSVVAQSGEEEGIKGLVLAVDSKSYIPVGAQVQHLGGNQTSVLFRQVAMNRLLSQDTFDVNYPNSVDVIDRRSS